MTNYKNLKTYFSDLTLKTYLLENNDFKNGTYRIRKPGYYKLSENIIFSPNENLYSSSKSTDKYNLLDNYKPTKNHKNYPIPPYQFGFFAAITVESSNVIIDLNNFTIEQDKMHYINQRFFSLIELNETPFIKNQGPSNFGEISYNNYIYIKNGKLGLTSHHGIHGNGNKNILIEDLDISNFEVAAIALNGSENCIINKINIHDSVKDTIVNFLYSNAIYARVFLKQLINTVDNTYIKILGKEKQGTEILYELEKEIIENVYTPLKNDGSIKSSLFKNKFKLPEGNIYAIVLNSLGVVVHDFLNNNNSKTNKNNIIMDVSIKNISSFPREVITLVDNESAKIHKGVVGDIIPYLEISDENYRYSENVVYNAIALISKYSIESKFLHSSKSLYIPKVIINDWFGKSTSLYDIKNTYNFKFVNLRDQMSHYMKGNIMIFISGIENCEIKNIRMESINNEGDNCDCDEIRYIDYNIIANNEGQVNYDLLYKNYLGNNINAILLTQSSNIDISNIICENIKSLNGTCKGIHFINNNNNITANNINIIDTIIENNQLNQEVNNLIKYLIQYIKHLNRYIKYLKF